MEIGFIVGIIISVSVLITGIIGLIVSKKKGAKNKWAWIFLCILNKAYILIITNSKRSVILMSFDRKLIK